MINVYVVGAGIVGVSCALNLLEKGFKVTLIEKEDKVKETSFGNAGVIARSSAYLINNKNLLPSLRKYIFNKHPAVRIKHSYLLKNFSWSSHFLYQSLEKNSEKNINSLDSIIKVSLDEHKKWLSKSENMHRLRENGWLKLFHSKNGVQSTGYEQSIYQQYGIDFELLTAKQINLLEPALKPIYKSGVHIKDAASVDHPGEVTQDYIDLVIALGGQVIRDDIKRLSKQNAKITLHGQSSYIADEVVIAAGPWSNDLLKTISSPLPMCFERGYHRHFSYPQGPILTRPVYDVDRAFVMSPTSLGYRITSGSELNDKNAEPNTAQLDEVVKYAHDSVVLGDFVENSLWKGNRPTLPDSLPAIGKHPKCEHIWLAFGHQHVGFSTGPATGRLIAELMLDQVPFIDITPFLPSRFF